MAFKGGTSLSKAYNAISRFSEDVDVTISREYLATEIDPFASVMGRGARDRMVSSINAKLFDYIRGVVEPHFRKQLETEFSAGGWALDIAGDGEELRLTYPTVTARQIEIDPNYIRQYVKIEFGGFMAIVPSEEHVVRTYLSEHPSALDFPVATTQVLAGTRTFWEKATLAHFECHRPTVKINAERQSRHWYDLYSLADHEIGIRAVADKALLEDVVKYKKVFYNATFANYDQCLNGRLRLIPDAEGLAALKADYEMMVNQAMIYGNVPNFKEIVNRLTRLEREINA
jgi:hypothetical protein